MYITLLLLWYHLNTFITDTIVAGVEVMSKNIKVYSEVFEMLQGMNIEEMLKNYNATKVSLRQTDDFDFLFCVNGKEIPFPKSTGSTRVFRVPEEIYDNLRKARIHPEESFSCVLFRLVAATVVAELKPYVLFVAPQHMDLFDRFDRYQLAYVCDLVPTDDEVTTLHHTETEEILKGFDLAMHRDEIVQGCDGAIAEVVAKKEKYDNETARLETLNEPIHTINVSNDTRASLIRREYELYDTVEKHDVYDVLDHILADDSAYDGLYKHKKEDLTESIRIPQHTLDRIKELMKKHDEDDINHFIKFMSFVFGQQNHKQKKTRR